MELKLEDWESFLYESRPYAYVAFGTYALSVDKIDIISMGFAAILIYSGILILRMRFKYRKASSLESLYYESLPFFYLGLGVYSLTFLKLSKIGVGSGVILLFCATKIFQWRIRNRRSIASH
ncbi:MAG: hypothetical protein ACXWRA_06130, partial [Pseudobdellovibrionaceae bacterium]